MGAPFLQQKFVCAHCAADVWRKPSQISNGTRGVLAGLKFCNRVCQKAHFRPEIECAWPGCSGRRWIEAQNYRVKQASGWLCDQHTNRMQLLTGSRKMTARKLDFLAGKAIDHNRLTWAFLKFVVYEFDAGICRGCRSPLEFARRPVEFHCDHIRPLWQGGITTRDNLQLLCIPCHKTKSSAEQKLVNQTRWKKRLGANFQRMTHTEKDALIARLLARISELECNAAHPFPETDHHVEDNGPAAHVRVDR
jgi:5-methylcytosine-specific restriction endonuclease McrA